MIKVHIWYSYNSPGAKTWDWMTEEKSDSEGFETLIPLREFSWGHAGMEFFDVPSENGKFTYNGYRSFWTGGSMSEKSLGRVGMALEQDIAFQFGFAPHNTITLSDGLKETVIYTYWDALADLSLEYEYRGFNSSSAVAEAIARGLPTERGNAPKYSPFTSTDVGAPIGFSNPLYLQKWLGELNEWLELPKQNLNK